MDFLGRVLVVLGCIAGAVTGAMAVAGVLLAAGMDVNTLASGFLLAIGAIPGAIVGARVNQASGRQLLIERAADRI